ncbi:hypothetical protein [Saccharomonospora viridis]|uniref:hypothetical protein n=1 Tax=Saccharomonospora viridis TaxID=1852 RepID=UPI0024A9B51B|nr:hypothetical protein [Saccharomonospora viridis]
MGGRAGGRDLGLTVGFLTVCPFRQRRRLRTQLHNLRTRLHNLRTRLHNLRTRLRRLRTRW